MRVLGLLAEKGIAALPYKGLLFLEKLYQNKSQREIGDLDIIVPPKQAAEALQVLIDDGYQLNVDLPVNKQLLDDIITQTPSPEIGLDKKTQIGINVHIDFHWGLNEFSQYKIDLTDLFETAIIGRFQQKELLLPSNKWIFRMLINHHGARECWVRLKDVVDLKAFNNSEIGLSANELEEISANMLARKIFQAGENLDSLIENYPSIEIGEMNEALSLKRIIGMWEYAKLWDRLMPKIYLIRIYRKLQDRPTSWLSLIKSQVSFHAVPNVTEFKRIYVLPKQYVWLNAFSKLLSYLIRMYVKPIFLAKK